VVRGSLKNRGTTGYSSTTATHEVGTIPAFHGVVKSPTPMEAPMRWTKPEAEIVAVTMEVTAYVATL
jgi:coenzyme PQQ precursor peptide PqqA